jgi:hypothetical protein
MLHLNRRLALGTSNMPEAAMRQNIKELRRSTVTQATAIRRLLLPMSVPSSLSDFARVA